MLTQDQVLALIAEALEVPPNRITTNSRAADFAEWDSMGILTLLALLDRHGVKIEIGAVADLQSVLGVLEAVRKVGRLS